VSIHPVIITIRITTIRMVMMITIVIVVIDRMLKMMGVAQC